MLLQREIVRKLIEKHGRDDRPPMGGAYGVWEVYGQIFYELAKVHDEDAVSMGTLLFAASILTHQGAETREKLFKFVDEVDREKLE